MNEPATLPPSPAPPEPTSDYSDAGAASRRTEARPPIALVAGTGPQTSRELQVFYHKRLRALCLIALGAMILNIVISLPDIQPRGFWFFLKNFGPLIGLTTALVWFLWRKPLLSLRVLRAIELLLVVAMWAFLVWMTVNSNLRGSFRGSIYLKRTYGIDSEELLAHSVILPWFIAIVLYGAFVPNTWRRCAVFVSAFVLAPLMLWGTAGLQDEELDTAFVLKVLREMAFFLVLAAAIAVYGSHRIGVLRQQADEARRLGQYRLQRRLGAGGMGEVYLAEHALLRRPCALKLIRPEQAGDPKNLRRFEREVQATATLTHPNTVQIYDYGHAEDGTFYYVMEYLPGLTLDQLVQQNGPLPPARAVHLLRQVCGALREAHAIGLIHRDLKPGNIMVCERGGLRDVAKLLDFGLVLPQSLAQASEKLTLEGAIAGTPAYMSPEQANSQQDLDQRSDLYSLGAVAYFLLTGQPPFVRPTPLQTLIAHLSDAVVPLDQLRPDVPADLQAVILRCLAKQPAERFADADSVEQALAGCAAASP